MTTAALPILFQTTAAQARTPRLRSMRQFAEEEIVLPTGPHKGRRFDVSRTPYAALWFAEQTRGWRRSVATGPQQSGKTLCGFVIPAMFHLFEIGETVICGLPSLDFVADKWGQDLLPAITASRYRDLLPTGGPGSRGGETPSITFKNGPTLKFMTGGGGDKSRAGYTARVLVVTEVDGMDEAGGASREADKITQLEGRTSAFGDHARIYLECTVSTESGRTWQEYIGGTHSRIAIRCQHCRQFVTPERGDFAGWQEARDVIEAGELARVVCPACKTPWTEEERVAANRDCRLVHRGQEIDPDGNVTGPAPRTHTLGFRWNATNNLLIPQSVLGQREWTARRAPDEENAEREMSQFVWAAPAKPKKTDLTQLDLSILTTKRTTQETRGVLPADTEMITAAVDVGAWLLHWSAIAWVKGMRPHILDYGRLEVPQDVMALELAVLNALRQFRTDVCAPGWGGKTPVLQIVDAGWLQDVVLKFCKESGPSFLASKGFGAGGARKMIRQTGSKVLSVGEGFEYVRLVEGDCILEINADQWKSWLHARLRTPIGQAGALTLFHSSDHTSFGKHLIAEHEVEEFVKGKGVVTRFESVSRVNHWLDSTAMACVAGHIAGQRLVTTTPPPSPPAPGQTQRRRLSNPWLGDLQAEWRRSGMTGREAERDER